MRASDLLIEGVEEFLSLPRRKLTDDEKSFLEAFQEVLKHVTNFFHSPSRDAFSVLKADLAKYRYPFMNKVNDWMKLVTSHHNRIDNAKSIAPSVITRMDQIVKLGSHAIIAKNTSKIIKIGELARKANEIVRQSTANDDMPYDKRFKGPLYVQNPYFFQTKDFIRQFEQDDIDRVTSIDPNTAWTYIDLPDSENFQHIAYWALELGIISGEEKLSRQQYNKWIRLQYLGDTKFDALIKDVEHYLSNNNRRLIPHIIEQMENFPDIVDVHERLKQEIDYVYRGIAIHEDDEKLSIRDIVAHEKKTRFVSTSTYRRAAENFAMSRGHLERDGRTDGVLLTYRVNPECIVLNTAIFGGIFGEEEIIIDALKAEIADHDMLYLTD